MKWLWTLALLSVSATAADRPARALGGFTAAEGETLLHASLGWPGLAGTLHHGVAPGADVYLTLGLRYGFEGIVTEVTPGLTLEAGFRLQLVDVERVGLSARAGAGTFLYLDGARIVPGVRLPLALDLAIRVSPLLDLHGVLEAPFFVTFGAFGGATSPILAGAGLSYAVADDLTLTFDARMGPSVGPSGLIFPRQAELTFHTSVGVTFEL